MAVRPSDARDHVNQIVTTLEQNMRSYGKTVREIVKSGSLGQGTAIDGNFDLDLVVYFKDIDPFTFDEHTTKEYFEIMDRILHKAYGDDYQKKGCTPYTLQFSLVRRSIKLEIDLLPSPFFDDAESYYTFLKSRPVSQRRMFSCTAAKWIQDFFEDQPSKVKEYIRRAKAWRNVQWPSDGYTNGRPKSFLISLLVIQAYEASSHGEPYEVNELVKRYVLNHSDLRIHWTHKGAIYSHKYVGYFEAPYIIDPSNPFNNVYESGISPYRSGSAAGSYEPGNGNWSEFVRKVDTFDVSRVNY